VVMVAPECAPAAKAGGLGDVVSGLGQDGAQLAGGRVRQGYPGGSMLR